MNALRLHPPPILRIPPSLQRGFERAIRPITRSGDVPMLDRIEMDVIHVAAPIPLIPYGVLPEPALPHRLFPPVIGRRIDSAGHEVLDITPTPRKIRVTLGQMPQGVQMIRQHDHCLNLERLLAFDMAHGFPQQLYVPINRKKTLPLIGYRREEITPPRNKTAPIIAHGLTVFIGGLRTACPPCRSIHSMKSILQPQRQISKKWVGWTSAAPPTVAGNRIGIGGLRFACPPYGLAGLVARFVAASSLPTIQVYPIHEINSTTTMPAHEQTGRVDKRSAVHRFKHPDRDWWTALRLSTLRPCRSGGGACSCE